MTTSIQPWTSI